MNNFDLLGKKRGNSRTISDRIAMVCGTLFLLMVFGFIFWFGYLYMTKNKLQHSYKKSLELIHQLEVAQKQKNVSVRAQQVLKKQQAIQSYQKQCALYAMLTHLAKLLPSDVRLTETTFTEGQMLVLRGEALSAKSLTNFVNTLKLKPCFEQCALEGMSKKKTKDRTIFDFIIKVNLTESHGQNKKIGAR